MNKKLFRAKMAEHGDTQLTLAEAMGMVQSAISMRINGHIEFKKNEINFIRKRYNLTAEETVLIFFNELVSESDTKKKGA